MAYSQGGIIEATDYNTRATTVNNLWGVGSGSNGYGQSTTVSNVSVSGTVTATNWATLIARIDSMRQHQSATTSGITQPSAGNTITFLNTLDTQLTTITTNKLATAARGTALPTALGNPLQTNDTDWQNTATNEFYVSFSDGNTVRYFFNAGGLLTTFMQIDGGTALSNDWSSFMSSTVGTITLGSNFCSRSGTGGDNLTENTNIGYHNLTTSYQTLFNIGRVSGTADYGNNSIVIAARRDGDGSNLIYFRYSLTDAAANSFNDIVNGQRRVYVGYTPPGTTYLSNTWGTPTSTSVTNTQT